MSPCDSPLNPPPPLPLTPPSLLPTSREAGAENWGTEGCQTLASTTVHTKCLCSRISTYAVLAQQAKDPVSHSDALAWCTHVGLGEREGANEAAATRGQVSELDGSLPYEFGWRPVSDGFYCKLQQAVKGFVIYCLYREMRSYDLCLASSRASSIGGKRGCSLNIVVSVKLCARSPLWSWCRSLLELTLDWLLLHGFWNFFWGRWNSIKVSFPQRATSLWWEREKRHPEKRERLSLGLCVCDFCLQHIPCASINSSCALHCAFDMIKEGFLAVRG